MPAHAAYLSGPATRDTDAQVVNCDEHTTVAKDILDDVRLWRRRDEQARLSGHRYGPEHGAFEITSGTEPDFVAIR